MMISRSSVTEQDKRVNLKARVEPLSFTGLMWVEIKKSVWWEGYNKLSLDTELQQ